jgi:hypothetical protein
LVLVEGAKADIVVFDGTSPNMLGWDDPVAAVILHSNPGDVEHVLVNGEFRKRDFKLVVPGITSLKYSRDSLPLLSRSKRYGSRCHPLYWRARSRIHQASITPKL